MPHEQMKVEESLQNLERAIAMQVHSKLMAKWADERKILVESVAKRTGLSEQDVKEIIDECIMEGL
jgi:hypothetical protein